MHGRTALTVAAALLAGCIGGPDDATIESKGAFVASLASDPQADLLDHALVCRVATPDGAPLAGATCVLEADGARLEAATDPAGTASFRTRAGLVATLVASHPEHGRKSIPILVDSPASARFVLDGAPSRDPVEGPRLWQPPVTIAQGSVLESQVVGDSEDRLYFSPGTTLLRSNDEGASWVDVTPPLPEAMPTLASDTGISVAPDGSLWFTRFWPYLGPTMGCTSVDHGASWTCDNLAIVGPTDRMWIAGLDARRGYVQAFHGFTAFQWSYTDSGSARYVPYAVGERSFGIVSNMVYDDAADAVRQLGDCTGAGTGTISLLRIDGEAPLIGSVPTNVPKVQAICWLVEDAGVLWTTGEPTLDEKGSRGVVAARSLDGGATWALLPVSQAPATATFSYIGAHRDRAAVVYYGADEPGQADLTFTTWNVYVAETSDARAAHPTWIERRIAAAIHLGIICIGADCQLTNQQDPQGRFSLDMIGAWMGTDGDFVAVYSDDHNLAPGESYHVKGQFVRQSAP